MHKLALGNFYQRLTLVNHGTTLVFDRAKLILCVIYANPNPKYVLALFM